MIKINGKVYTKYIIDSSSLINLKIYYPQDVFEGVWEGIQTLANSDRLGAPIQVKEEVDRKADEVSDWCNKNNLLFSDNSETQVSFVEKIMEQFPNLVKDEVNEVADPWLVALALEDNGRMDVYGNIRKCVVVSEEKAKGHNKIPVVCNAFKIDCINTVGLFRNEGWTLKLR